jgi:murein DD-endopeptidase MepM/ murein hydrolase activator NlpD
MQRILRHNLALCLLFPALVQSAAAQVTAEASPAFIVDTVAVNGDSVVFYSDKSWEYLNVINFDGIMNAELHNYIQADSNWQFTTHWFTNDCYSRENDLSSMPDTIWTCVVDSNYSDFHMPIEGPVISTFKHRGRRFHYGIDLDLETGDTVRSAFSGRVRYAQYNKSGYGNLVIVRHHNGLETYYAHFSKILVSPNQEVKAGQIIGLGGSTGRSTGSHLHFEVRFYDNALNPETIIDFKTGKIKGENLLVHKGLFSYKASSSSSHSHSTSSSSSSVAQTDVKYHKIRSGDSLYKIARKHGTTIDKLCALNNMSRDKVLKIGLTLKVR